MASFTSPGLPEVVAAGAVVVRKRDGGHDVLLVHRPRYDDWSFPKGKLDAGEHVAACAVREVREETGLDVRLGVPLPDQHYWVQRFRRKIVHYWMGRVRGNDDVSTYAVNREVDAVEWVPWEQAARRLTHRRDRSVLVHAAAHRRRTDALVVLRHGEALPRKSWSQDDRVRPLAEEGVVQARALVPLLAAYGVEVVVSSTSTRCLQTVEPYAAATRNRTKTHKALSEEDADPVKIAEILADRAWSRHGVVVCSHRPVLPSIFDAMGVEPRKLEPAGMVVVHHRRGEVIAVETWQRPL